MPPELLFQAMLAVGSAAAVWGAIRADIKHLIASVDEAKRTARKAHERLDLHIQHHLGQQQP